MNFFSASYGEARERFLAEAGRAGAEVKSYPVTECGEEGLAVDVACLGGEDGRTVVVSSGLHGVEGFFGSALQLAFLDRMGGRLPEPRIVLVHGLNPYGFAKLRRANEDNVDLNRSFLGSAEEYRGAPEGYGALDRFLNPGSPPESFGTFRLRALWHIRRHGMAALGQAVAGGQYEYPRGLFYGGKGPCETTRIVSAHCDDWVGGGKEIVHLDLHSGLGEYGKCKLLVFPNGAEDEDAWYGRTFGEDRIGRIDAGAAYAARGAFGAWMKRRYRERACRALCAEFGTYGLLRVLAALRTENRAHHHAREGGRAWRTAKKELLECFCPADTKWRSSVIREGLEVISLAIRNPG